MTSPSPPIACRNCPPPRAPNQVWLGDITYIATEEGWLYLAGILDLYSRRLTGWAMSEHIDTQLILAAWGMALTQRQPPRRPGLSFGSRRPIRQPRLSPRPPERPGPRLHEPQSQLLRQCHHGILLEHPQTRIDLPPPLQNPSRKPARQSSISLKCFTTADASTAPSAICSPIDFENQNN